MVVRIAKHSGVHNSFKPRCASTSVKYSGTCCLDIIVFGALGKDPGLGLIF